ncbi:MAG: hypothetical protein RBT49_03275 [Bacteroidales bacterium]|jgi:hypothetical protein|nr:hypothetical protein [Bacteroidales bacterium]
MERNILVAIILMFLLSPIYSMSDDGGNVPVVQKEEQKVTNYVQSEQLENPEQNNENKIRFYNRDESFPIKTIQTSKGDFSYYRAKNGDIVAEYGGVLVGAGGIIKDINGNEIALDGNRHNTGLTVDEFVKHQVDYTFHRDDILEKNGIDLKSVARSTRMWYDNRINLDKLDELKENGFDALPEGGHGIGGGSLESICIGSEAVIIGEIVGVRDFNHLYVKIIEVLKSSIEIENKNEIECYYERGLNLHTIPRNQEIVISLNRNFSNKTNSGLLKVSIWFDIIDGIVTHNENSMIEKKKMPLETFKTKVRKLIEINDADTFYKRSWKEALK